MSKNIGRENANDPHFRYKRPVVQAKVEGRGNGIKTNVVNNKDIARALDRPAQYLLKFFGFELGAQTNYKEDTGLSIVNGQHSAGDLEKLVDDFIDQFVICHSCKNPETVMKVSKRITLKCKACGYKTQVGEHKLNTYIFKHPPADKETKAEKKVRQADEDKMRNLQEDGEKGGKGKKEKEKKKSKKSEQDEENGLEEEAAAQSSAVTTQVVAGVANGTAAENGAWKAENDVSANGTVGEGEEDVEQHEEEGGDDGDEEWTTDTSAAAVAMRQQQQLSAAAARMVELDVHEDPAEREAADRLKRLAGLVSNQAPPPEVYALLLEAAGTKLPQQMKLLYRLLLQTDPVPFKAATKNLQYLTYRNDMKRQAAQLIGLEAVLADQCMDGKQVKNLFMTLYNEDVLAAETIIYWYEHPELGAKLQIEEEASKKVRAMLDKVVEELREDLEDEDEDEEEE